MASKAGKEGEKEEMKEYLPDLLYDSMDEANGLAVFF